MQQQWLEFSLQQIDGGRATRKGRVLGRPKRLWQGIAVDSKGNDMMHDGNSIADDPFIFSIGNYLGSGKWRLLIYLW